MPDTDFLNAYERATVLPKHPRRAIPPDRPIRKVWRDHPRPRGR
jgi:hypothetical protein